MKRELPKPEGAFTAPDLIAKLAARYPSPAWAFLVEVGSRTGFSGRVGYADALALSLFPSRGLEMHGFEVKVSRSDWLRELKDPAKADEFVSICHRWWIVAPVGVVLPQELPSTWGLLVPRGKLLHATVAAPVLQPEQISLPMLAAIFRRAGEAIQKDDALAAARKEAYKRGEESARQNQTWEAQEMKRKFARLEEDIRDFEQISGVRINGYMGEKIGHAVRQIIEFGGPADVLEKMRGLEGTALSLLNEIKRHVAEAETKPAAPGIPEAADSPAILSANDARPSKPAPFHPATSEAHYLASRPLPPAR